MTPRLDGIPLSVASELPPEVIHRAVRVVEQSPVQARDGTVAHHDLMHLPLLVARSMAAEEAPLAAQAPQDLHLAKWINPCWQKTGMCERRKRWLFPLACHDRLAPDVW